MKEVTPMERLSNSYATTSIYVNTHQRAFTVYLDLIYRHRNDFWCFFWEHLFTFRYNSCFLAEKDKSRCEGKLGRSDWCRCCCSKVVKRGCGRRRDIEEETVLRWAGHWWKTGRKKRDGKFWFHFNWLLIRRLKLFSLKLFWKEFLIFSENRRLHNRLMLQWFPQPDTPLVREWEKSQSKFWERLKPSQGKHGRDKKPHWLQFCSFCVKISWNYSRGLNH